MSADNLLGQRAVNYTVKVEGFPTDSLEVVGFQQHQNTLAGHYSGQLQLLIRSPLRLSTLLGKSVHLQTQTFSGQSHWHALITGASLEEEESDECLLTLDVASPLYPLLCTQRSTVYTDTSIQEIVTQLLNTTSIHWQWDITQSFPTRPQWVQYQESDGAYLQRLLGNAGCFLIWAQGPTGPVLHLTDNLSQQPSVNEPYPYIPPGAQVPQGVHVHFLSRKVSRLADSIYTQSYQRENPKDSQFIEKHNAHPRMRAAFGRIEYRKEHYQGLIEGEQVASHRLRALDSQREIWEAFTDDIHLQPGMEITVQGHPAAVYNRAFRITGLSMEGTQKIMDTPSLASSESSFLTDEQKPGFDSPPFLARLTLCASDVPYCLPYQAPPDIDETILATIETRLDNPLIPDIDEDGFYRLRFAFDESTQPPGHASGPIPALQAHGGTAKCEGEKTGAHFLYLPGSTVLVRFFEGDPDDPVIIGQLANPWQPSGVNARHPFQTHVTSFGQNEILLDDIPTQPYVQLSTYQAENRITLGQLDNDLEGIALTSEQGEIQMKAEKNLSLITEKDELTLVKGNARHTVAGNQAHEIQGNAHTQIGADYLLQVGGDLQWQAKVLESTTQGELFHESQGDMHIISTEKDVHLHSADTLRLHTGGSGLLTGNQEGFVQLYTNDKTGIHITKEGDTLLQAKTIILQAEQIDLYGEFSFNPSASLPTLPPLGQAGTWNPAPKIKKMKKTGKAALKEYDHKFDIQTLHISEQGKKFIFEHETFKSELYDDLASNSTIGYGHLVHYGKTNGTDVSEQPYLDGITQAQAEAMFDTDIIKYENIVKSSGITAKVTQNQFDALVSFVYNEGHVPSITVTAINNNNLDEACNKMLKYNKARDHNRNLVYSPGLAARRHDEVSLFQKRS